MSRRRVFHRLPTGALRIGGSRPWKTLLALSHHPAEPRRKALKSIRLNGKLLFIEGVINQSKYTSKVPSNCPKNQDHLRLV